MLQDNLNNLKNTNSRKILSSIENFYNDIDHNNLKANHFEPVFDFLYIENDFTSILPYISEDYNVIYSSSPAPNKTLHQLNQITNFDINKSNDNSVEYLGNKRIRSLTPPLNSKVLTFSPFNKKSSFTPIKNNSAFKNLNVLFHSKKKDK